MKTNRREILGILLAGLAGYGASNLAANLRGKSTQLLAAAASGGQLDLRKGYLDGPYGQIHYYEQGVGPCLILAHQSPVCARAFERAMPYLAVRGIRAVAIDTPGFGNSAVPKTPPTIREYADIYDDVLAGLGIKQAHFLGHHTGASAVCSYAARNPDRVSSLILNGPPLFSQKDLQDFSDMEHKPHPIFADGSHLQIAWDRRVKYTPGWTDKEAMHRRVVDSLWAGDTSWYGHHAAFSHDMEPDLMAVSSRSLILTNTGDDIYDLAQKARSSRPDMEYVELQGGTHDIVDEQPEAWSHAVAEFVLAGSAV